MKKLLFVTLLLLFFITSCDFKENSLVLNIISRETLTQRTKNRYLEEAKEYMKSKKYEKAEKYLKKALEIDKKDPVVYYKLGILYELMGKDDKSIACYLKAIEINPGLNKIETE